ncbi:uncharacterized protein A4U43_C08F4160 [Asparagus officinalis]|uniref:uncharacterized protein LOC109820659 n=1 Tax=Asparagus officinalis TaxID=4686 RepID=UPI00098DFC3D|nr:uncharacterized protein LOC109820659 [Asparagus officinalis]ONK59215.1 uncharacterized protein A4U43_C08F4160 [Asparagus officinalis]
MGLLSNKIERSEIKSGDHIYTWRAAYTYSHHGIYVGGEKVVHFTRKKETSSSGLNSSSSSTPSSNLSSSCLTFPDCGFQQPNSGVILSCLDCFLGTGSLYNFEYGVTPSHFLAKVRGGTCTIAEADPPESVIHRAMYLLRNGFGNYDLFENNCEDFAIYCKTGLLPVDDQGVGRSGQASSFIGMPLAAMLSTPFKLLAAGPVGMATVTAGMYCAGRYITDIGVRKDVVKVKVEELGMNLGWKHNSEKVEVRNDDDHNGEVVTLIDIEKEVRNDDDPNGEVATLIDIEEEEKPR